MVDQAEAANREAVASLAAFAEVEGHEHAYSYAAGPVRRVLERLGERITDGRVTRCPHLPADPTPCIWVSYRPGRLRCRACASKAARSVRGTREDSTCDSCRRRRPGGIWSVTTLLRPVVLDRSGQPPVAAGPIVVHLGLCGSCHAEQELYRTEPPPEETSP